MKYPKLHSVAIILSVIFFFTPFLSLAFFGETFLQQETVYKDGKTIKVLNFRTTSGGGERFLTPASEFFLTPEKALEEANKRGIELQRREKEFREKKAEEEKLKAMEAEAQARTKEIIVAIIVFLISAIVILAIYLFAKKFLKFSLHLFMIAIFPMLFLHELAFAAKTQRFSDIPPSHKYYKAIEYVEKMALDLQGYPDGTFRFDEPVSRAMACFYFLNSADIPIPKSTEKNDFSDVEQNSWYHPCVQTAKEWGFISGYPDGTFRPTENITNAAALVFLLNAHGLEPRLYNIAGPWYEKYVLHAREKNLINSDFNPNAEITKGQLVDMLYQFLKQGPLARVPNSFLEIQRGQCPLFENLKKELEAEVKKMPKPEQISLTDQKKAFEIYDASYDLRDENFNDTAESIVKLKEVVSLNPYFPLAWHNIAMYEINHNHNAELGMRIEQKSRLLVPNDPATTYAVHGIARAFEEMGDLYNAEVCYKESIKFMPGNHWPYLRLAQMLREEGKDKLYRYREAIFVLLKGLDKKPMNDLTLDLSWETVNIFNELDDYNGAEFIARKQLKNHPDRYPFIMLLGKSYANRNDTFEISAHYHTLAMERTMFTPDSQTAEQIAKALKETKMRRDPEANYFGNYVQSTQPFVDAFKKYWTETTAASLAEALSSVNKALELNPDEARYLILKARILSDSSTLVASSDEILSLLKKAKKTDPFFYDGFFLEGEAYLIKGDFKKARRAYKKVPSYHIDYAAAQKRLKSL